MRVSTGRLLSIACLVLLVARVPVSAGAKFGRVRAPGGLEAVEDQPHCDGALADRGGGALDRPAADVSHGEDPRPAGLQEPRCPALALNLGRGDVAAGEQESMAVPG